MHLEVIRMIVDALTDSTTGVQKQLDTVPKDPEDVSITITAPVKYLDPTRDDQTALTGSQLDFPILLVSADEPAEADGDTHTINVHHRQADAMPIAIRMINREADSAAAVRDALYCERAVVRAIRQWLILPNDDAKRKRNGISVISCPSLRYGPVDEIIGKPEDKLEVMMAVRLGLVVRDLLP